MDLFNSAEFTTRVEKLMKEWHVPGLAIAVVQNDTIASNGYGNATLSPDKPVTGDTLFDIASSSKSLTAASVAFLVADDNRFPKVKWESLMSELLPDDFVMSESTYTESITVEDVLSHRTGLPRHDLSYLSPRAAEPDTPQSIVRNLKNLKVAAPVRSKHLHYNNIMYTVASYLVEQITGSSFKEFLKQTFFDPLGMTSTNLLPANAIAAGLQERIMTPYWWSTENQTYTPVMLQHIPEAQGAGSIITSVNDYIKWVKAIMNQEHPISTEIYKGITKPRIIENPDDDIDDLDPRTSTALYAAGLSIRYYRGYKVIDHDGSDPGVGSKHFFLPELKFGGVILGNSNSADQLADVISHELIDEALQVPASERPDWNSRERERDSVSERESQDQNREQRTKLCPDLDDGVKWPQNTPLEAYTGQYWNAGYHGMTVEIKDDQLFVDATDRTMGFTLAFEHLCNQTVYIAHSNDYYEGREEELAAEFRFENDKVVRMGIDLESELEEYIWFDKVVDGPALLVQNRGGS